MFEIKNISRMGMFAKVVEMGSFTRAAESLCLSKGALSRQVVALEDALGLRLLQRTPQHFKLTSEGEVFHHHCREVLKQYEMMEVTADIFKENPAGTVVVDVPPLLAQYFLIDQFPAFFNDYPEINLDLRLQESRVSDLSAGVDIAVIIDNIQDSSANCRRLGSLKSILCAAPSYVDRHGLPTSPDQLIEHNCLIIDYHNMPGASEWVFYKNEKRSNVKVSGNLKINNVQLINELVMSGQGIALQPDFMVKDSISRGELVPVLAEYEIPKIPFYLIYLERKNLSPKLRVTIDFLVCCFKMLKDSH